jgi:hypothetical protein
MTQRKKTLLYTIIILVIIFFGIDRCKRIQDLQSLTEEVNRARLQNQAFESQINEQGEEITMQRQLIVSKNEAIKLGMRKIEGLTNYKNQISVITETKFDTIYAAYESDTTTEGKEVTSFKYNEPWISFDGQLLDSGVAITDLNIKNEYVLTISDKKIGFFKKPEPTITLLNKNPYTETKGLTNIAIKQQQSILKRPWIWLTFGITSGILITRL